MLFKRNKARNLLLSLAFLCPSCSSVNVNNEDLEIFEKYFNKIYPSDVDATQLKQTLIDGSSGTGSALSVGIDFSSSYELSTTYDITRTISTDDFIVINSDWSYRLKSSILKRDEDSTGKINITNSCKKWSKSNDEPTVFSKNYSITYHFKPYINYLNQLFQIKANPNNIAGGIWDSGDEKFDKTYEPFGKKFEFNGLPYCERDYQHKVNNTKKGNYYYWFFDIDKKMFAHVNLPWAVYLGKQTYSEMKVKKYYFDDNPRIEGLSFGTLYLKTSNSFKSTYNEDTLFYDYCVKLNSIFQDYGDTQYVTSVYDGGAYWIYPGSK